MNELSKQLLNIAIRCPAPSSASAATKAESTDAIDGSNNNNSNSNNNICAEIAQLSHRLYVLRNKRALKEFNGKNRNIAVKSSGNLDYVVKKEEIDNGEAIINSANALNFHVETAFSDDSKSNISKQMSYYNRRTLELLQLNKNQEEINSKIAEDKKKMRLVIVENRQLTESLRALTAQPELDAFTERKRVLKLKNNMLKQITLLLILESGVDWVNSPELKTKVLE